MARKTPKLHQKKALGWGKRKKACAFFMEMRLGKSLVAILWAEGKAASGHHLIVCPLSVVPSWRRELEDEGVDWFDISSWSTAADAALEAGRPGFYVINYEQLIEYKGNGKSKPRLATTAPWDTAILDESPRIKSPRAQITKILSKHLQPKYRALLSGMPDPEGVEDFVTQLIWLKGSFMGHRNYWTWRAEFCKPSPVGDWIPKRGVEVQVNKVVNKLAYVLTRKQAGMFDKKVREIREVKAPAGLRSQLRSAIKSFEIGDTHMTDNALVAHTWTERLAAGCMDGYEHCAKDTELVSLLKTELAKDQQIVVYGRFTAQLKKTVKRLQDEGIACRLLIGATKNRADVLDKFRAKKFRVLVAQTKIVKEGTDLSVASTLIYISNYHSYDTRAQSEDRCFHPEKREAVLIIDIVIANTADACVPVAMREKSLNARGFQKRFLGTMLEQREVA